MTKINLKLKKFKGWFWFCPIYWEKESRTLSPRFYLWPLLEFALSLHQSMIFIADFIVIDIDDCYPIKITDTRWAE